MNVPLSGFGKSEGYFICDGLNLGIKKEYYKERRVH